MTRGRVARRERYEVREVAVGARSILRRKRFPHGIAAQQPVHQAPELGPSMPCDHVVNQHCILREEEEKPLSVGQRHRRVRVLPAGLILRWRHRSAEPPPRDDLLPIEVAIDPHLIGTQGREPLFEPGRQPQYPGPPEVLEEMRVAEPVSRCPGQDWHQPPPTGMVDQQGEKRAETPSQHPLDSSGGATRVGLGCLPRHSR